MEHGFVSHCPDDRLRWPGGFSSGQWQFGAPQQTLIVRNLGSDDGLQSHAPYLTGHAHGHEDVEEVAAGAEDARGHLVDEVELDLINA